MSRALSIFVLVVAASLEAGGDALMRAGLRTYRWPSRIGLFCCATLVLSLYGWAVNSPPWGFGKLLGLYVVFFFLIAQLTAWLFFREVPSNAVLVGGSLIVAGGLVISFAKV